VIDVHSIQQEHVSKGTPILVLAVRLEEDFFLEGAVSDGVLGSPKTSPPYQFFKPELF
jgi:hypothetical protein